MEIAKNAVVELQIIPEVNKGKHISRDVIESVKIGIYYVKLLTTILIDDYLNEVNKSYK